MAPVKREVKHKVEHEVKYQPKLEAKDERADSSTPPASPVPSVPIATTNKSTYRMSDKEREIIVRLVLDGKRQTDIAEMLGIKVCTVRKFLERKKQKAMNAMDPEVVQLLARVPSPKKRPVPAKRDK